MYKDVNFEKNYFDETHWKAIDDKLITELHEKHKILPCAFTHSEFLLENRLRSIKEKNTKMSLVSIKDLAYTSGPLYQTLKYVLHHIFHPFYIPNLYIL